MNSACIKYRFSGLEDRLSGPKHLSGTDIVQLRRHQIFAWNKSTMSQYILDNFPADKLPFIAFVQRGLYHGQSSSDGRPPKSSICQELFTSL